MSWETLNATWRKARKEHECVWCGETIVKGERYLDETGLMDGDFINQKWHKECSDASNRHWKEYHEDDFDPYSFKRGSIEEK